MKANRRTAVSSGIQGGSIARRSATGTLNAIGIDNPGDSLAVGSSASDITLGASSTVVSGTLLVSGVISANGGEADKTLSTNRAQTTDGTTVTPLFSFPFGGANSRVKAMIHIDGICTAGPDAGKCYSAVYQMTAKDVGGVQTIAGTKTDLIVDEITITGLSATQAAGTANANVRGKASDTIKWSAYVELFTYAAH